MPSDTTIPTWFVLATPFWLTLLGLRARQRLLLEGRAVLLPRYSYASDVWSFGVTIYEAAMLAPPFRGSNICQARPAQTGARSAEELAEIDMLVKFSHLDFGLLEEVVFFSWFVFLR